MKKNVLLGILVVAFLACSQQVNAQQIEKVQVDEVQVNAEQIEEVQLDTSSIVKEQVNINSGYVSKSDYKASDLAAANQDSQSDRLQFHVLNSMRNEETIESEVFRTVHSGAIMNHMDHTMLLTRQQQNDLKYGNKYASVDINKGIISYSENQLPEEQRGIWLSPYFSFDKVDYSNINDKVENTNYGVVVGGDTDIIEMKHGWSAVYSAYLGYQGSHSYISAYGDSLSIYQNGGLIGLNGTWFKNDFFTGLDANYGIAGGYYSMSGIEDTFSKLSMTANVTSKTGYNWRLFNDKFIIQPSWQMAYKLAAPFGLDDMSNDGHSINPAHVFQIAPQVKFIGNLPHGWQPYIGVAVIWNMIFGDKNAVPYVISQDLTSRAYVQYGLGLQKSWCDRFSAYGQVMFQGGGRNGVGFTGGLRMAFGK